MEIAPRTSVANITTAWGYLVVGTGDWGLGIGDWESRGRKTSLSTQHSQLTDQHSKSRG
ncbi:hypothetical protein [Nostoc sp. CMAA1605]|uniref:hypothetical protein n=1 Tax=Nostoc sp. CMAA1605 TaxID=2055159 RepID=UPI001F40D322|nr:hypothetical protein [Nostoc sp. CMAA1605]